MRRRYVRLCFLFLFVATAIGAAPTPVHSPLGANGRGGARGALARAAASDSRGKVARSAGSLPPFLDLIVHEWGTFLAMQGADGLTLDGMYHEEHALPAFVHARGPDQLRLPAVVLKGETPVIYFYTRQPRTASVEVDFPHGIWTQWYPQATFLRPHFAQTASPPELRDGRIGWWVNITPAAGTAPTLPSVGDALWRFARDVDAAFVSTRDIAAGDQRNEYERFLFYRGLGQAPLPLAMTAAAGGTLTWQAAGLRLRHALVLRVENGKGAFRVLPTLTRGHPVTEVIPSMDGALPVEAFSRAVGQELTARLTASGLYPKEARAMVNTWRESYFRTAGVRVLFVLPQAWTDAFIPMRVYPDPRQVVRVMVGRLELLTPEREQRSVAAVRNLASADSATREGAFAYLRNQGRFVEPILRHVSRTTSDEQVRTLVRRLLLTDFVTDLRAALHSAPSEDRRERVRPAATGVASPFDAIDGTPIADAPVFVRAQLASLLKEIGLDAEAKAEAAPAHAALQKMTPPAIDQPRARHYLRAYARTMEGLGDDAAAARAYARFVRFGSQTKQTQRCNGCHFMAGPRDMAWFRDWWAGRKFAAYTTRAGVRDAAIAEQEQVLARDPNDPAARLMLAYLYAAKGEKARAEGMWTTLGARMARR